MHIVLISEVFVEDMGYLENVLPKYLARLGAQVDVIASSLPPDFRQDSQLECYRGFAHAYAPGAVKILNGFRLHVLGHTRTLGHLRLLGLRQKLSQLQPDVVQTMTPIGWIAVDSAMNQRRLGYRLFSGCHYHASVFPLAQEQGTWLAPNRVKCLLQRGLHGRAVSWFTEKYYAISPDCAEVATRFFGVPRKKLEICPLGVDTEVFHPIFSAVEAEARRDLRARLGFQGEEIVCVYSGRFTADKNPLLLARAITELNSTGEPFRALFVGDGPQAKEISRSLGCVVQPFVPMGKLPVFYRAADIGIWPTQESMSMLDAAACGLPLIANDHMGARERLRGCGLQYRLGDVADLARVIRSLRDPEIRKRFGARGAQQMKDEFSWEAIAGRRINDYSASLAGKEPSPIPSSRALSAPESAKRKPLPDCE